VTASQELVDRAFERSDSLPADLGQDLPLDGLEISDHPSRISKYERDAPLDQGTPWALAADELLLNSTGRSMEQDTDCDLERVHIALHHITFTSHCPI
jgi:hypothetical protein